MPAAPDMPRRLPAPEIWAEAARRETGRDKARDVAVAALDSGLWERPILETLYAMVLRQPDHPAIVDAGRVISYGAFWNLIAAMTARLRAVDAPAGAVAVLTADHAEAAAALFACLGAGRVCVPLDARGPMERNVALLRASGTAIMACGADAPALRGVAPLLARADLPGVEQAGGVMAPAIVSPLPMDAPAFIFPTSGSTGAPKLVVHSQRTMAHRGAYYIRGLRACDRMLTTGGTPGSYTGMRHLLSGMFAGASVHQADIRRDGLRGLLEQLRAERVTILRSAASLLRLLAVLPNAAAGFAALRLLRHAGEPLLRADVALLRPVLPAGCVVLNCYGATEAIGLQWPALAEDPRDPVRIPAGHPEPDIEAIILDEAGAPCPPGEAGELVLRGRYHAIGEWQDGRCVPGRLIPDPSVPGARVYFTGDLARAGADGCVVVLGRVDRMVKINGQRVEPMEVESAIRKLADVADVIVLPRMVGQSASLVAFVMARSGQLVVERDLRDKLRAHVPAHMLPSRLVVVDALPRLPSGKVDGVKLLAGLSGA